MSGNAATPFSSALSLVTIGFRVPAGAVIMPQPATSNPGTPDSAIVTISGADGERAAVVTPSARTLPSRISGSDGTGSENNKGTWPATTSVSAGALPL